MADSEAIDPEFLAEFRKFQANAVWAAEHESDLQMHRGKYVAVDDCRLLGVSRDAKALRKRFARRNALYVTFVSPPDMAWVFAC